MKHSSLPRRILLVLAGVLAALALAVGLYLNNYYHADAAAQAALALDSAVTVTQRGSTWVFAPQQPQAGLIFYPGAKVEATAYAPLLHELAQNGVLCVLVKMPGNLAILSPNAADGIAAQYPDVADWYIGGHSLGGAMAANYAASHTDELDGLVLLVTYSTKDLTASGLRVFTAYGSADGVLNRETYAADFANLPDDTVEWVIDGGCHAGFGSYGPQDGDGTPSIPGAEQISLTADAVAGWMMQAEN